MVTIGVRAVDSSMSIGQRSVGSSIQERVRLRLSHSGSQEGGLKRERERILVKCCLLDVRVNITKASTVLKQKLLVNILTRMKNFILIVWLLLARRTRKE